MSENSLEDLTTWAKARELRNWIWYLVKSFPKDEKYRLTDQIYFCEYCGRTWKISLSGKHSILPPSQR